MYSGHSHLCVCQSVCLSLAAFQHYCMYLDVTWGMAGVALYFCTVGQIYNPCTGVVDMTS